ncbi:MAG: 3-keto-5-aminohexanoate cleavage protein [Candidatus Nezhaarchaeota archaeon]|nr:3-keto-5-aminohexanoate cleavage protein [Candidatus Nezhaarchaeota archaeon]MCX8142248.1 3-keto-5-aminohexanoate cleavage protein [Candidatus Nezhaarchaeota archaeon]MDW8050779.1 3-keto-5-aminohexanoate cleavage protein [Nitrososphaerota archaeon]
MKADKLIITCAITGSIHTPSMSPYLPITPDQIADEAIKAAEAGAAIVHIHARDPRDGRPTSDLKIFREILTKIKERSDVVICVTTGGGIGMTAEERVSVVPEFEPEMCSLNMGSMNFSPYPKRTWEELRKKFKYPWEHQFIELSYDFVFKNTFKDIETFIQTMYRHGTKPELECYDVGHIWNAYYLWQDGVVKMPIHVQFVLGVKGGIGATSDSLLYMKQTADALFGPSNYTWSVAAAGRWQFPMCTLAAMMGGHVRVGLEDNLFLGKGELARSNAELVKKMVRIVEDILGWRTIATPDDAREILGLKGKDRVKF